MRKLASIQTVTLTEPIPQADAIERMKILGWWVVGKKGEYRPGDKVVYCEIDSLLPERPEFEFLRPSSFKSAILEGDVVIQRAGFRIKTVKLRGQVSQGICFPLSIVSDAADLQVGTDVTDLLDIIKYEPPIPVGMGGRIKGAFPAFLPKTDETRIQVLEPLLQRYRGTSFHVTEKLDGSSMTEFFCEMGNSGSAVATSGSMRLTNPMSWHASPEFWTCRGSCDRFKHNTGFSQPSRVK